MIDESFQVGSSPSVRIAVRSGQVRVEPAEPGNARFEVDTTDPSFEVVQRGDSLQASGRRGGRAEVLAHLPPGCNIEVSTGSADVEVIPDASRLEVSTASGDLNFEAAALLIVRTASGSVRGNLVDREAHIVTASGDISLDTVSGRSEVSTASGDVHIRQCEGSLSASTLSGDLRVLRLSGQDVDAKSMSGRVRIGVPPRTRLDLDARSLSGKVRLPEPNPNPEPPEREVSVKVRLVSGDLRIDRVE